VKSPPFQESDSASESCLPIAEDCITGLVSGIDRSQGTMIPAQLDDDVAEDNPARVIDCS